jgi:DNA polymerase phi
VKSSILFSSVQTVGQWEKLLGIICGIASKKPWLREQCGWLLCSCVKTLTKDFNSSLITTLVRHKLLRTPEGVAIWLNQEDANLRLQSSTLWKHGSPLSRKGASTLANIMKDAKPQQADSDASMDSQGKAMWSPQLHFAWDVVLRELYNEIKDDRLSFQDFWLQVVDRKSLAEEPRTPDGPDLLFVWYTNYSQRVCSRRPVASNESIGASFYSLKYLQKLQRSRLAM